MLMAFPSRNAWFSQFVATLINLFLSLGMLILFHLPEQIGIVGNLFTNHYLAFVLVISGGAISLILSFLQALLFRKTSPRKE
jgi:hypothetical protein